MRYIIMADGKGNRWNNFHDMPKHFIKFGDETLLERTVRLIHQFEKAQPRFAFCRKQERPKAD